MKLHSLIIGEGGLLGKALKQEISRRTIWQIVEKSESFTWTEPAQLKTQLQLTLAQFVTQLSKVHPTEASSWVIFWAAGSGVIGATKQQMEAELATLHFFLSELEKLLLLKFPKQSGYFFLASSAGGIYGSPKEALVTEYSKINPISEYGLGKLKQEELLASFCARNPNLNALAGRISSLYGCGQNFSKKGQGFIAQFSRSLIFRKPINVFVSLDTLRDYIYLPDCVEAIVETMTHLVKNPPNKNYLMKLFISGDCISLSKIIGVFSRIHPLPPGVLAFSNPVSNQHANKLRLVSQILTTLNFKHTPIEQGIAQVHQYHLKEYLAGRLPQPT